MITLPMYPGGDGFGTVEFESCFLVHCDPQLVSLVADGGHGGPQSGQLVAVSLSDALEGCHLVLQQATVLAQGPQLTRLLIRHLLLVGQGSFSLLS